MASVSQSMGSGLFHQSNFAPVSEQESPKNSSKSPEFILGPVPEHVYVRRSSPEQFDSEQHYPCGAYARCDSLSPSERGERSAVSPLLQSDDDVGTASDDLEAYPIDEYVQQLLAKINVLEVENQNLKDTLSIGCLSCIPLNARISVLEREKFFLQNGMEALDVDHKKALSQVERQFKESLAKKDSLISDFQLNLAKKDYEIRSLTQAVDSLRKERSALSKEISRLNKMINKLSKELHKGITPSSASKNWRVKDHGSGSMAQVKRKSEGKKQDISKEKVGAGR